MEKEQEVERERDRARSTKFFDSKFNFNEPPPKVRMLHTAHYLYSAHAVMHVLILLL